MIEPWIVNRILSTAGIELQNDDVLSDTTIQVTKILPGNTLLHEDRHLEEISIVSEKVGFIVLNDNPSAVFVHGDTEIPLKRGTLVAFDGNTLHQTKVKSGVVDLAGPFALRRDLSTVLAIDNSIPCSKADDCEDELGPLSKDIDFTCFCTEDDLKKEAFAIGDGGGRTRRELGRKGQGKRNKGKKGDKPPGSFRRRAKSSGKGKAKCGKAGGDEQFGICSLCADAEIYCDECRESGIPGETICCDDNPTKGEIRLQRTCDCNDDSYRSCENDCFHKGEYRLEGKQCCTDKSELLECPSCLDVYCTTCDECTKFQEKASAGCCEPSGFTKKRDLNTRAATCGDGRRRKFRFLKDVEKFNATPDDKIMAEQFLEMPESDPSAYFTQAKEVIPVDDLIDAVSFVEEKFQAKGNKVTDKDREMTYVKAKASKIVELLGMENVMKLLDMLYFHTGNKNQPVTRVFFQRFEHDGDTVSPYHTDGDAISLVLLLNDDYEGGEMTFLTQDGATVIDSIAGSATVHGAGVVHGNAAVKGIKYQLTFLTYPNTDRECLFKGLLTGEE